MLLLLLLWWATAGLSFWALGPAPPWWAYPLIVAGWIAVPGAVAGMARRARRP